MVVSSSSSPSPRGRSSEPIGKSPPLTCILDEIFQTDNLDCSGGSSNSDPSSIADDPITTLKNSTTTTSMDQTNASHQVTTGRSRFTWGNVKNAVGRSLSPIRRMGSTETTAVNNKHYSYGRRGSNEAPARIRRRGSNESAPISGSPPRRKLPPRQGTFDTAASGCSSLVSCFEDEREKQWAEERVELLEKIEALESKLQSKEAVMKSLMSTAAQNNTDSGCTSGQCGNNHNSFTTYPVGPLASLVLEKEKELTQLEATVKEQAIYIEQMEVEQEQAIQVEAEELFHEWQQQQEESNGGVLSTWEQWQEQEERISTLQAENEHIKQLYQRQSRQINRLIDQFLVEKKRRENEQEEEEEKQQKPPPQPRRSSLPDLIPCAAGVAPVANYSKLGPQVGKSPTVVLEPPIQAAHQDVALGYGIQQHHEQHASPLSRPGVTRRCSTGGDIKQDSSSPPVQKGAQRRFSTSSTMSCSDCSSDRTTMTEVLLEETRRVKTRLRRLSMNGGGVGVGGSTMDGSALSRSSSTTTSSATSTCSDQSRAASIVVGGSDIGYKACEQPITTTAKQKFPTKPPCLVSRVIST